jgi:hypothetical protein
MSYVVSERVQSVTEEYYVPASIDAILNSNVFLARLFMRENKQWTGRQIVIPVQFAKPTSGGSFSGTGNFDTSVQDTRRRQTFTHSQFYQNVTIVGGEASLNKTDAEVLDLMKLSMEEACNAAQDSLGDQLYDNGAGEDILGLGGIIDAGANTSSYGGLSRTTYPQLNSTIVAASAGALTFGLLANVMRGASAASSKRQRPSIAVCDETVWDLLESKYTPTINANYDALSRVQITTYSKPGVAYKDQESLKGHYGYEALYWRGIPIVADEKADAESLYMVNEEYLHWYNLKGYGLDSYKVNGSQIDGVSKEYQKTYPMQWTGFQKPSGQYAQVGQFISLGNVISGQTRRMGKATGITTV